jgi:hypothetical protein
LVKRYADGSMLPYRESESLILDDLLMNQSSSLVSTPSLPTRISTESR